MIMTIKILSILMVLIGSAVLFLSLSPATKIYRNLIGRVRRKWIIILYLMGLFIFGYLIFDIILIINLPFPIELVTGCVFLGGAVFVFLIINVSLSTIAELHKAKETILVAKNDWESTFNTVTDMITVHDMDFNIIRANKAAREIFGLQQHEGIHLKKCFRCYHGTDKPLLGCVSCQSIQTGKPSAFEYFEPHLNKYLEMRAMPKFGNDGRLVGLIHVARDITDHKNAEQEKLKLEYQLHQAYKMESIGTLAGGIAHDFNNILSSIIGFTELALDDVKKDTTIMDNLQEVYTAGIRAKDLVCQILAFARQSEEEIKPIKVDSITKEVIKFIRSSIPTTIEIKQNIESDSLIMGNATQFHQILMNLCTNAAYAMEDKGGILEVDLKDVIIDSTSAMTILGLNPANYIQMKVSDTGVGISPDIIGSIWDPYFTTKELGEGTGMGLSIVHGIIESYGGKITVESTLGERTVFTIYLPITRERMAHSPYEPQELPQGNERILFVDDEAPIAKMGGQALERLGYTVSIRTSSIEALELFRTKPNDFDLVITDMTMPNMTGDRLAIELMKIRPDIPVILCTGYSKNISEESASEMGIKAFIYKPIVKADLAKTVRKVLDEAKGSTVALPVC